MTARRKIIIDTDPGVDDILAILLAFASAPEELEILLISLTYGNVEVDKCLRNVISLFYHIHEEIRWRKQNGKPTGYGALLASKPLVAVGADHPLADTMLMADYFHGTDGLGGIAESHPHLTPNDTWKALSHQVSRSSQSEDHAASSELSDQDKLFRPSQKAAHEEIINLLKAHPEDEITIVAVGPMTNVALAAAADPTAFLRVKEVVVMGGAVSVPGNITPVAEFNTFADSYAAARVYALSSPNPSSTMPPVPPDATGQVTDSSTPPHLADYPPSLPKQLPITLFPLDITSQHTLSKGRFDTVVEKLKAQGSPLAAWVDAFVSSTFRKVESLRGEIEGETSLEMHDPLCVWYCIDGHRPGWRAIANEDLRVETTGQWTRGMCVVDGRNRKRDDPEEKPGSKTADEGGEKGGDHGGWLSASRGNRLGRCVKTSGSDHFAEEMLKRIFGS
ncbi:hypothetical protein CAC42_6080 [Sphaceloma murrayae]|uniref:Inosine/uridine-preferring nucleoside hydrolase domain-containing protein n=1 Tax=Sphaceloma murrayae TaxID=2082308 RepID=A0A2K1QVA2_9PEZI|nr:hypothetical protein CAC42_6080 [Sphaceloma murrayae]